MARTSTKINTRELLLQKGAEIIHKQGFNHTGINEILAAADVPKGSFYFYFKNKEDFGLQLIDYFLHRFQGMADAHLSGTQLPYLDRFRAFLDDFLIFFEQNGFIGGCPIGNFSLEMSGLNENFRKKLMESFEKMKEKVLMFLQPAQSCGEVAADVNLDETADFIVNSWEGALMRIKVTRNRTPMMLFYNTIFGNLLKKCPSASVSPEG
jgi:TetR/AcrR family transcriptional repressor of nem operon